MRNGSYRPAPDVWDGMPVSADGSDRLPRPSGWKYERWGGRLRLEPDGCHEIARWVGPPLEGAELEGVEVSAARRAGRADLVDLADAAFRGGPDFFAFPAATRRQRLRDAVSDALDWEPEWVRDTSRTARSSDGHLAGMVLVREVEGGVVLDTVAVRPEWRRRGIAALLFESVRRAVPRGVEVRSAWLIANRESDAWHRSVGFEVIPTSVSERSRRGAEWGSREDRTMARCLASHDEVRAQADAERDGRAPDPFTFSRPIHRRARA